MTEGKISSQWKIGLVLFFVLLFSYAYFPQKYNNWNSVSRLALSLAIVEDGTITIDRLHRGTGDKTRLNDHYYSDKAPGMSFTALPVVAVARPVMKKAGLWGEWWKGDGLSFEFGVLSHLTTVCTSGLATALAALVLYLLALRMGLGMGSAVFAMLSYGLGSMAWGWATAFFGHAMAGTCLFLAFALISLMDSKDDDTGDILYAISVGMLLSWAVVVEYTAGIAVLIIALYGVIISLRWSAGRTVRVLCWAVIAGIITVVPLAVYNTCAYGGPLQVGYQTVYTEGFVGMQEGFMGITYPKPTVIIELLFLPFRGLFFYSPILVLVPFALLKMGRFLQYRIMVSVIISIIIYYILMNSAYHYWQGGWSSGPRHLVPMLPFACLSLAFTWERSHWSMKKALLLLLVISGFISLVCVSVDMYADEDIANPIFSYLLPRFLAGDLRSLLMYKVDGFPALLPLALAWLAALVYCRREWHRCR